jgi:hypothetical protein
VVSEYFVKLGRKKGSPASSSSSIPNFRAEKLRTPQNAIFGMLAFCAAMCAHTLGAVHSVKDMIKGTNRRPVLTAKANSKEVQCIAMMMFIRLRTIYS